MGIRTIRRGTSAAGGFVLVTALLFLVALTIVAISATGTNILEERMSGQARDRQIALEAAEAALRDAERYAAISDTTGSFLDGCATGTGLCLPQTDGTPLWRDFEDDGSSEYDAWVEGDDSGSYKSVRYGKGMATAVDYSIQNDGSTVIKPAKQPRYIVEQLPKSLCVSATPLHAYRLTAVGFGRRPTTRVMLQSIYVPFRSC